MMYVMDTNVVSEAMRPRPDYNAIGWIQDHCDDVFMTVITVKELYYGIFRLPEGKRKRALRDQLDAIVHDCVGKTLSQDAFSAYLCAEMHAAASGEGRAVTIEDCMIAAICKRHDAVLATRNVKDFEHFGIQVVNPFEYESPVLKRLREREARRAD